MAIHSIITQKHNVTNIINIINIIDIIDIINIINIINIITNQSEEGWKWVGLVLILKPDNLSLLVMWLIFIFL